MRIHITSKDLDVTESITRFIKEKIQPLEKFVGQFEEQDEVDVYFEIARTTNHHKSGDVFYAEANVEIDGKLIRAEETEEDIRTAIDKIKDTLQREFRDFKEKHVDKKKHMKRPGKP